MSALPKSLADNPRLDRWVRFDPDGTVHVSVGKVEIGQGIATALAQIAAEELDVSLACIAWTAGDTDAAPDEGMTTGSLSIEIGGASLRLACAEIRALFLAEAARRLNCAASELDVAEGAFLRDGAPTGLGYAALAADVPLTRDATAAVAPKPVAAHRIVGSAVPRLDLPGKLAGGGFLHDIRLPGMIHARVLRQPRPGARLAALDISRIGPAEMLREGDFVAFLAQRETDARRALQAAIPTWADGRPTSHDHADPAWLETRPAEIRRWGAPEPAYETAPGPRIRRRYGRPYTSHASLGPSCAIACYQDGHMTVWSHSQGVYPLRAAIAAGLGLPETRISVRHAHGSGCYGHNGADDAAMDAAVIALRRPGAPVRVQWQREDEFGHAPVSTAMLVEIDAAVDAAGWPVDWTTRFWAAPHAGRGGFGATALAIRALPDAPPLPKATESSDPYPGSGTRNAVPYYDLPAFRYEHHFVPEPPVRTSALRGLGANAHVFAIESFIDELAAMAGTDPAAYRLRLLADPRARAVIESVVAMSPWAQRGPAGSGRGLGLGFARYKNHSGMAAIVAEVEAGVDIRVSRIWCAADAGLVVNPDGVRAQLEGAIIQAVSWTLKEEVRLDDTGIVGRDWAGYPILRFSEIPAIELAVMPRPQDKPLGMGECAGAPTVAAVAAAVRHALDIPTPTLPLTRERLARAALG